MSAPQALEPIDLAALDPGIRDTVERLRALGYQTCDSGDGVSKPASWYASGEALPYPHIVVKCRELACLAVQARVLRQAAREDGRPWDVEATFDTRDGAAFLVVSLRSLDADAMHASRVRAATEYRRLHLLHCAQAGAMAGIQTVIKRLAKSRRGCPAWVRESLHGSLERAERVRAEMARQQHAAYVAWSPYGRSVLRSVVESMPAAKPKAKRGPS